MVDRTREARFILRHLRRAEHELHLVADHGTLAMKDVIEVIQTGLAPLIHDAEAVLEQIRLEDEH